MPSGGTRTTGRVPLANKGNVCTLQRKKESINVSPDPKALKQSLKTRHFYWDNQKENKSVREPTVRKVKKNLKVIPRVNQSTLGTERDVTGALKKLGVKTRTEKIDNKESPRVEVHNNHHHFQVKQLFIQVCSMAEQKKSLSKLKATPKVPTFKHTISKSKGLGQVPNGEKKKELKVIITPIKVKTSDVKSKQVVMENQLSQAHLEVKAKNPSENFKRPNLRKLPQKTYQEEESLIMSSPTTVKPTKKSNVPIYKQNLAESPKRKSAAQDLYEFNDTSPSVKKNKRAHRSSIGFDKNTHEILKKIEAKESKARRKIVMRKKSKKTYEEIVSNIVKNVKEKIKKKDDSLPRQEAAVSSLINPNENILPAAVESKPNESVLPIPMESTNLPFVNDGSLARIHKKEPAAVSTISKANENFIPSHSINHHIPPPHQSAESTDLPLQPSFGNNHSSPVLFPSVGSSTTNSSEDVANCFGFEPAASTPAKTPIRVISDIVLNSESPIDFSSRRPDANSTMVVPAKTSSPWRANWVNVRHNPHFVSLKSNALPRIDQEPVLEHTFVENFESGCSKTPQKVEKSPKKKAVQQSILDFVNSNVNKENEPLERSLFDYEAFASPVKAPGGAKRKVLGCPSPRKILGDLTDNSVEQCFGFEETSSTLINVDVITEEAAKPCRFDLSRLRRYAKRTRKIVSFCLAVEEPVLEEKRDEDNSVSLMGVSNEENEQEVHLFEEPEEMLDNMSPPHLPGKPRRKRLNSGGLDFERKKKKEKKTETDPEQKAWIEEFNKMCDEVESHQLELE